MSRRPSGVRYHLVDFVAESNRIEGIHRPPSVGELRAHTHFLELPEITIAALQDFVTAVASAALRAHAGMDVRIGMRTPELGGPGIVTALHAHLDQINGTAWQRHGIVHLIQRDAAVFRLHREYEHLHPFMDGNGRSGRALWLWMMGGIDAVPLGFLHTWYYQSLG